MKPKDKLYKDMCNTDLYTDDEAQLLNECYNAKFINNDEEQSEYLKNLFEKEYGYWGDYY